MVLVQLLVSMQKKMQIDPFLSPCTKLKPKWIKDLHIKPDTLKLIEEKGGLEHMGRYTETNRREKRKDARDSGGVSLTDESLKAFS